MPYRRRQKLSVGKRHLKAVTKQHTGYKADFNIVYNRLREAMSGDDILEGRGTHNNLVPLLMTCIRLVERIAKDDSGQAKKQLVLQLITRLIADSEMSETEKHTLQVLLESLGPAIIDGLIDADHGRLLAHGFKKLREKCSCCAKD